MKMEVTLEGSTLCMMCADMYLVPPLWKTPSYIKRFDSNCAYTCIHYSRSYPLAEQIFCFFVLLQKLTEHFGRQSAVSSSPTADEGTVGCCGQPSVGLAAAVLVVPSVVEAALIVPPSEVALGLAADVLAVTGWGVLAAVVLLLVLVVVGTVVLAVGAPVVASGVAAIGASLMDDMLIHPSPPSLPTCIVCSPSLFSLPATNIHSPGS